MHQSTMYNNSQFCSTHDLISHPILSSSSSLSFSRGHSRSYSSKSIHYPKSVYHRAKINDKSEISCCLKYLIFSSNVIFWLIGLAVMIIGFWAWNEKDIFNNFNQVVSLALDPAFVLIVIGFVGFTIGFTGCIGALRESTSLLATVSHCI
jgi:tetraspanin, putative